MSHDLELGCRCGEVHGWLRGVSHRNVNRALCYCADCQAYLHQLGRADLLDAHGGTDLVQVSPRSVSFDRGTDRIAAVRLTSKGMHRWYASCCKTPLGNTTTLALPFVGMPPEVLRGAPDANRRDELFGKVRAALFGDQATGGVPEGAGRFPLGMMLHVVWLLLGWKLSGKTWPHPFFDRATQAPRYPVTTLTHEEREALRSRCGQNAVASATAS